MSFIPCAICGSPCRDHGPAYQSCCRDCAVVVQKERRPTYVPGSWFKLSDPTEGDGFPEAWKNEFERVKQRFQSGKPTDPPTAVSMPVKSGAACARCKNYNEYAVPNQTNGTFLCYGCRRH